MKHIRRDQLVGLNILHKWRLPRPAQGTSSIQAGRQAGLYAPSLPRPLKRRPAASADRMGWEAQLQPLVQAARPQTRQSGAYPIPGLTLFLVLVSGFFSAPILLVIFSFPYQPGFYDCNYKSNNSFPITTQRTYQRYNTSVKNVHTFVLLFLAPSGALIAIPTYY